MKCLFSTFVERVVIPLFLSSMFFQRFALSKHACLILFQRLLNSSGSNAKVWSAYDSFLFVEEELSSLNDTFFLFPVDVTITFDALYPRDHESCVALVSTLSVPFVCDWEDIVLLLSLIEPLASTAPELLSFSSC